MSSRTATAPGVRRHTREAFQAKMRVAWQDHRGEAKSAVVDCLDIARDGVSFCSPEMIPLRSIVQLKGIEMCLDAPASVRSCRQHKLQYIIGVEFLGGCRWEPDAPRRRSWD